MHHDAGSDPSFNANVGLLDSDGKVVTNPVVGVAYQLFAKPFNMIFTPINVTAKFYYCKTSAFGTTWADYSQISYGQAVILPQQSAQIIASSTWTFPETTHTCLVAVAETATDLGPQTNPSAPYTPKDRHVGQYNLMPVPMGPGDEEFAIPIMLTWPQGMQGKFWTRVAEDSEIKNISKQLPELAVTAAVPVRDLRIEPQDGKAAAGSEIALMGRGDATNYVVAGTFEQPLDSSKTSGVTVEVTSADGRIRNANTYVLFVPGN